LATVTFPGCAAVAGIEGVTDTIPKAQRSVRRAMVGMRGNIHWKICPFQDVWVNAQRNLGVERKAGRAEENSTSKTAPFENHKGCGTPLGVLIT
jgi:hypothetical protein